MFILVNIRRELAFDIFKVNGKTLLKKTEDGIIYKGIEASTPCSYYVVRSDEKKIFLEDAVEAWMITFEIIYETGVLCDESNVDELVLTFGSKKSANTIRDRKVNGRLRQTANLKFSRRAQILPSMNENAKSIEECFLLEDMFHKDVLESFLKISMNSVTLHPCLVNFKQNMKYKMHILLADCIIKFIEKKYVTENYLNKGTYASFYSMVEGDIEGRRLTPLCKDRLAVLCYILFLQIEGFTVQYSSLPNFGFNKGKVVSMFKLIGCSFSSLKGVFKLDRTSKFHKG